MAGLCEYPGLSFQRSPVCACSFDSVRQVLTVYSLNRGPNRPLEPNPLLVHSRVLPEFARSFVNTGGLPPCALIAGAMDCAVMGAAQRYNEFVARLAAERPRLQVAKMMRVRRLAAALHHLRCA